MNIYGEVSNSKSFLLVLTYQDESAGKLEGEYESLAASQTILNVIRKGQNERLLRLDRIRLNLTILKPTFWNTAVHNTPLYITKIGKALPQLKITVGPSGEAVKIRGKLADAAARRIVGWKAWPIHVVLVFFVGNVDFVTVGNE